MQSIIANKNTQSRAVLQFLQTIFTAIIEDKAYHVLEYMAKTEPPTYQYARYWDSLRPWVASEVDVNRRNASVQAYWNELELSVNVLSQIEQIEKLTDLPFALPQVAEGVIEYPENDGGQKPYIMWEIKGAEVLPERYEHEACRINMFCTEVTCTTSKSFPTAQNNLALLDAFNRYGRGTGQSRNAQGRKASGQGASVRRRAGYSRGGSWTAAGGIIKPSNRGDADAENKYH